MAILSGGVQRQKLQSSQSEGRSREIACLCDEDFIPASQVSYPGGDSFPSSVDLFMPWHSKPKTDRVNPGFRKRANG